MTRQKRRTESKKDSAKNSGRTVSASSLREKLKTGKAEPLSYDQFNRFGYKLLSRGRGSDYEIVPINKRYTEAQKKQMHWTEISSNPSDRYKMYFEYLDDSHVRIYPCKVKFGKEYPLPSIVKKIQGM